MHKNGIGSIFEWEMSVFSVLTEINLIELVMHWEFGFVINVASGMCAGAGVSHA